MSKEMGAVVVFGTIMVGALIMFALERRAAARRKAARGGREIDVSDLIAWMRTVPPSDRPNQSAESPIPAQRLVWRIWRVLFAGDREPPQDVPPGHPDRGRYLTEHVAICGDCHTSRTIFGTADESLYMAGGNDVGETVPNITSDRQTGIGDWDLDDIVASIEMGMLPNYCK